MAHDIINKIDKANKKVTEAMIGANPTLIDIKPAIEVAEGMTKETVLHAGPPVDFADMNELQKRSVVNGVLYEKLASTKEEATKMIEEGKIKIESALDHNAVGAGVGLITASINLFVVKETDTGTIACGFPAEGNMGGGFCGWGIYNDDIIKNFKSLNKYVFPPLRELLKKKGGISLKPILAQSLQMGDENHTRQVAADSILLKNIISDIISLDIDRETLIKVVDYISKTERIFHAMGQASSLAGILSSGNVDYSTIVTAMAGNGVEFGIKVNSLGNRWFTAPAPYIRGRFIKRTYSDDEITPWLGDSCVIETNGLGGLAAAASPIVISLRGKKFSDAVAQTAEMKEICFSENRFYAIPNIDYGFPPIGIDIRKVIEKGITPEIHGGIFDKEGGLVGAGSARVPMECFKKALRGFAKKYGL